jgi:hypothetical protein
MQSKAGLEAGLFVVATGATGYIWIMPTVSKAHRIVLGDHVRLPGRFFGQLTASAQAEL